MIFLGFLALVAAFVVGLGFLVLSDELALFALVVLTAFFVGLLDFYARIESAYWASYALAVLVFARFLFRRMSAAALPKVGAAPISIYLLGIFLIFLITATSVSGANVGILLVGTKIYLPMLLIIPVVAYMDNAERFMRSLEKGALILPFIEAPFVVHQHFFVATQRRGGASWDSVVGTFGGNPFGGGANPTLMLFLLISLLVAVSLVQDRKISLTKGVFVGATSIVLIGLGEVKAVFLIAPIALLIQQASRLVRNPIQSIILVFFALLGGRALQYAYEAMYWSTITSQRVASEDQRIDQMLSYIFDPSNVNYATGEVGRAASLSLWFNDSSSLVERLLGHGAASTRVQSSVSLGEIGQRYYPLDLSATAISQLLWDSGLIGVTCFTLAIIFGLLGARKNARRAISDDLRRQMTTISAILGMLTVFLVYNRYIVDRPAEQLVLAICLGLVWKFNRARERQQASRNLPARAMPA